MLHNNFSDWKNFMDNARGSAGDWFPLETFISTMASIDPVILLEDLNGKLDDLG